MGRFTWPTAYTNGSLWICLYYSGEVVLREYCNAAESYSHKALFNELLRIIFVYSKAFPLFPTIQSIGELLQHARITGLHAFRGFMTSGESKPYYIKPFSFESS